jgi:two-component system, cell cycle response regulator DivK
MAKILVVEDNLQNLRLARLVLERERHTVLEAMDGESGLLLAREARPDLVLMDVQMPGMDGLTVVRMLRADPATAGLKVLALTALAMKGDAERVLAAGCDAYLAKPFQYRELIDTVKRLLG